MEQMYDVSICWYGETQAECWRLKGEMNLQGISNMIPYPTEKCKEFDALLAGTGGEFVHKWDARGGPSYTEIRKGRKVAEHRWEVIGGAMAIAVVTNHVVRIERDKVVIEGPFDFLQTVSENLTGRWHIWGSIETQTSQLSITLTFDELKKAMAFSSDWKPR
ncbi:MAG: hypothetical protein ACWGQW_23350 [bacterium]